MIDLQNVLSSAELKYIILLHRSKDVSLNMQVTYSIFYYDVNDKFIYFMYIYFFVDVIINYPCC